MVELVVGPCCSISSALLQKNAAVHRYWRDRYGRMERDTGGEILFANASVGVSETSDFWFSGLMVQLLFPSQFSSPAQPVHERRYSSLDSSTFLISSGSTGFNAIFPGG